MFPIYVCGHDNGRVRNTCCHISLSRFNENSSIFWFQFHSFFQQKISFGFSNPILAHANFRDSLKNPKFTLKIKWKMKTFAFTFTFPNAMEHFFVILYHLWSSRGDTNQICFIDSLEMAKTLDLETENFNDWFFVIFRLVLLEFHNFMLLIKKNVHSIQFKCLL